MVSHSDDFGATWTEPTEGNIKFPAGSVSLNSIWALETATSLGPEVGLAEVDPAALFRSHDRGETFQLNEATFNRVLGRHVGASRVLLRHARRPASVTRTTTSYNVRTTLRSGSNQVRGLESLRMA